MSNYDLDLGVDFGGDDDSLILGDDDSDTLGADVDFGADRRRRGFQPVKRYQPQGQMQVCPFPRTSVAATTTTTVTAFPQRTFRVQRFMFASSVAASFTVDELKVGQDSMLVQSGSIPAELFSQLAVGVSLAGYIARPGVTVTLTVTNTSAGALTIAAAIVGPAVAG